MSKVCFVNKWKILTKWAFGRQSLFVTTATIKAKMTPTQRANAQTGKCSPISLLLSEKNQMFTLHQAQHLAYCGSRRTKQKWYILYNNALILTHLWTISFIGIRRFSVKLGWEFSKNILQTETDSTGKSLFFIKTLQNHCLTTLYAQLLAFLSNLPLQRQFIPCFHELSKPRHKSKSIPGGSKLSNGCTTHTSES